MKLIGKIFGFLALLYLLFWIGLATYFSYAERQKGLLEDNLSSVFKREVTIDEVKTAWHGLSPVIQINGFKVAGDSPEQAALSFESVSTEISPLSLISFWPQLTEFVVERPTLEIVSLADNSLQVAGIRLGAKRSGVFNPKRLLTWLLNHQNAVWHNGEVVWRKRDGDVQRYSNISFIYQRELDNRKISAATETAKGAFAFKAETNGDILETADWDASFEVLGEKGKRLLSPDDLSLSIEDGKGSLNLKTLDIERIKDFLLITGLSEAARWVLDANLSGRLHDMRFDFSGALLDFTDWSLAATASDVGFDATPKSPGMNNLRGEVSASKTNGRFLFTADKTKFDWPKWFGEGFEVDRSTGEVRWSLRDNGEIHVELADGLIEDQQVRIWGLNASCIIDPDTRSVSKLADLFKLDSVADLSYEDGELIQQSANNGSLGPLFMDASAKFEVKTFAKTARYIPNDPRAVKFKTWWQSAFLAGSATNGELSYRGEVSKNALKVGKARLSGKADFSGVEIDYGYQQDWPLLTKGEGRATLENDLLTIIPEQGFLDKDRVSDAVVTIERLFNLDRSLGIQASMQTSLTTVMEFLFAGPLIKPALRDRPMPIKAIAGKVSANVKVTIPLARVRDTKVDGVADITGGEFELPLGVPISDAAAKVYFTERSAESNNISARFLDGRARAKLITTQPAQPPKLKVTASGEGDIANLEPWIGEHILSLIQGVTDWQGSVAIDGAEVDIFAASKLKGVVVNAPAPLTKSPQEEVPLTFSMKTGSNKIQQRLEMQFGDHLALRLEGDMAKANTLLERSMIKINDGVDLSSMQLKPGINFDVADSQLDLDDWWDALVALVNLETKPVEEPNTAFLDAMRSIKVKTVDPKFLGRQFGALDLSAVSVDGRYWIGTLNGDNVKGTLQADPRAARSNYKFNLSQLHIVDAPKSIEPPEPINRQLRPADYPRIELNANSFRMANKSLGRLELVGAPDGEVWKISRFEMIDKGIRTSVSGQWVNDINTASRSSFEVNTVIEEAGDVLDEMDFNDIIKKGSGTLNAKLNWIGAPHEFDFARLDGDFDLTVTDGELVKVEPGGGKLLGLLNFNVIARRLIFDFRDVFSAGLTFDRMQYSGLLASGEAIMREAHVLTPSVFLRMEGKINLDQELIDMEIHVAPELGGNLALLSALANPAAGAVVYITQRLFKDQMRSSTFKTYRALGTWDEFEIEEVESDAEDNSQPAKIVEETNLGEQTSQNILESSIN